MNFKDAIEARRRQAAQSEPVGEPKPISEMSEAELAAEEARLREEIRKSREREVQAGREKLLTESRRPMFLGGKRRRRPYWK